MKKLLKKLSESEYSKEDMEAAYLQGHNDTYESEYYGQPLVQHFYHFEEFIAIYNKV